MMYILFGHGNIGEHCCKWILGEDQVLYFVDNDRNKRDVEANVPTFTFDEKKDELKNTSHTIIVTVLPHNEEAVSQQLKGEGICNYLLYPEFKRNFIQQRLRESNACIHMYRKAVQWVKRNSVQDKGIRHSTLVELPYPEVTGYFIPSLLRWGQRDLAITYAKWLCSIQKLNGSWFDTFNKTPYVFDTGQILKGLIAIKGELPEVEKHIKKGCDWLLSNVDQYGRLHAAKEDIWNDPRSCSELIHLYCLSPLKDAGLIFGESRYTEAAERILCYYIDHHQEEIKHFSLLSHFYAYVMEGLLDMGQEDLVRESMESVAQVQGKDGSVPAYNDVHWICSTGLFQLALVWFRLGERSRGEAAFSYACSLQNATGGWFGSYLHLDYPNERNTYFTDMEISWANKYFLDALYYRNVAIFDSQADRFLARVDKKDERYLYLHDIISQIPPGGRIADIGCGKGRYVIELSKDFPNKKFYALDISPKLLSSIATKTITVKKGMLTCLPYGDDYFDVVYTCEAMEHAVDLENAVREMARVVKSGGYIVIVDKSGDKLGEMVIEAWEQWPDIENLLEIMKLYCYHTEFKRIHCDDGSDLFGIWTGIVK